MTRTRVDKEFNMEQELVLKAADDVLQAAAIVAEGERKNWVAEVKQRAVTKLVAAVDLYQSIASHHVEKIERDQARKK